MLIQRLQHNWNVALSHLLFGLPGSKISTDGGVSAGRALEATLDVEIEDEGSKGDLKVRMHRNLPPLIDFPRHWALYRLCVFFSTRVRG